MTSNRRDTFMERAALFASPVDSSSVPKKKVARERPLPRLPLFENESRVEESIVPPTPTPTTAAVFDLTTACQEDDVEPMEVDTTVMPSPQRTPKAHQNVPVFEKTLEAVPENVPCTRATTPRRKSMPTPGKKLCFTSREVGDGECKKANESSLLELLIANNPEDIPQSCKIYLTDKKEMTSYLDDLKKEMEQMEAIQKSRKVMLQKATEFAKDPNLSSTVPNQQTLLDLTLQKAETQEDIVRRLFGNFAKNTQSAGQQLVAKKKAEAAEREANVLQSKLQRLLEVQDQHSNLQKQLLDGYRKEQEALAQTTQKMRKIDELVGSLKPICFF